MRFETPNTTPSPESAGLPELETVANELQVLLMPLAYQEEHPLEAIDMSDQRMRREIAEAWITQYAPLFREYLEDPSHTHETIDMDNPAALKEFLSKLKTGATLH